MIDYGIELFRRSGNRAIDVNPPSSRIDIHLTNHGSDWLWAVFSVFGLLAIGFALIFAFTDSQKYKLRKIMYIIPLVTNAIMAYCYFTYASNLGYTSTKVEMHHVTTNSRLDERQVFYVKYIGWFLCWPFVLFAIEIASGNTKLSNSISKSEFVEGLISAFSGLAVKVIATEIFVLGLLIGILIPSSYRWGYFTFSLSAQLFAMSLVSVTWLRSAKSANANRFAFMFIGLQLLVWLLYPVCWGLSEGGNVIQPDSEAVFYGILDLLTFAVIPSVITWINAAGVDEGFFHKLMHPTLNTNNYDSDKIEHSPRHSGDTAVNKIASPVEIPQEAVQQV